jgi:hypothetical protein
MHTVMFVLERPQVLTAETALESAARDKIDHKIGGLECWRVEATPERTVPPTTYELCYDLTSDRWSLSRG